jgi:hypothetical protein
MSNFVTEISLFWFIPIILISLLLTVWFYHKNSWFSVLNPKWRWTLPFARFLTFVILGLLCLGFIFESVDYRKEKPIVISLIDASSSMLNYKDSNLVQNQLSSYSKYLKEKLADKYELVEMKVGGNALYGYPDKLNAPVSNLSDGFDKIHNDFYNRNIGGILFISDGNFNEGSNPLYSAEKLPLTPIFSLGVGDTVPKRDLYIKNVTANEVAFLNNKFPIEVDVEAVKIGKETATVSLSKDGKTIDSKAVNFKDASQDFSSVSFLVEASDVGFHNYTVSISRANNEYNYVNNKRSVYIEVIDSRSKILLLASSPHPDVAAFKYLIEQDQNCEVISNLVSEWDKKIDAIDMIIWFDPGYNFDQSIQNAIVEKNKPVWYVVAPNTSAGVIEKLKIGMTTSGGTQTDEMQGYFNPGFKQFELSDETKEALNFFPPLTTKFGTFNLSSGSEILVYQKVGSIKKSDPLLYFNKRGSVKYGVLFGQGVWKWKLNDYVRTKTFDHIGEMIQKSLQYLLVKQNDSPLRVTLPKRFSKDEEILVNASFYNEAMELITTPVINLNLTDEAGKISKFQFGIAGNMYKLSMGKLNPGKYTWSASTTFNGKNYKKSGVFVVEDISLEQLDNHANHNLLKQLTKQSNGVFNELKDFKKSVDALLNRGDIATVSYKETSFNDLIDERILFFILLLLLTFEWFMRRWHGSY